MTSFGIALLGIVVLLGLLVIRIPVAVAMITVGIGGYVSISGWLPWLNFAKTATYGAFSNYDLSVIPMFLLMSQFAGKAGLSRALFEAANTFLGHRRGGVAMAKITSTRDGGIRMPNVPPAASAPVASAPEYS